VALTSDSIFGLSLDYDNPMKTAAELEQLKQSIEGIMPVIVKQSSEIMEQELRKEIDRQGLIDSGDMRASIASQMWKLFGKQWDVISDTFVVPHYSYYIEFGTVNHKAYKFARIAFARAYPKIVALFEGTVSQVLSQSALF